MDKNLPASLSLMFGHEGGYSNRKTDRGGPTKYGVTARTLGAHRGLGRPASALEVKALTLKEAEEIYRKSYWGQSGGSILPSGLDYAAFDFGVNSGPSRAVKVLQRVVGAKVDGIVGVSTLDKVNKYPGGMEKLIRDYVAARMAFLRSLKGKTGFPSNGRGWTIRVTGEDPEGRWQKQPGVIGHALEMYRKDGIPKVTVPVYETEVPENDTMPDNGTGSAKADPEDTGWMEILKNPEALAPVVGVILTPLTAVFEGNGPVQWALAASIVAAVGVGVVFAAKRIRSDA